MKWLLGLGKLVAVFFWLTVLLSLFLPFAYPFATLLKAIGGLVLLIHVVELMAFGGRLHGRPHPWMDRLQVLLFGVFHLVSLPRPGAQGGSHA